MLRPTLPPLPSRFQPFLTTTLHVLRHPLAQRTYRVIGGIVLIYTIITASAAYFIYKQGSENFLTKGVERIFPYPAAYVNDSRIPLSRFRAEVAARQHYASTHDLQTTPEETETFVMRQLVNRSLYAQALDRAQISVDEASIERELSEINEQVGGSDKLAEFLRENYGPTATPSLFTQWIRDAAVESTVQRQLLTRVTLRHILVAVPEGSNDTQVEAARQKALTIRNELAPDLAKFTEVASNRSEDVASRDNGGNFGQTNRGDDSPVLSAEFENSVFSLPVGKLSEPIRSPFGWHLVVVDERVGSIDLSKKAFTEQLWQEGSIKLLIAKI